jgi:hypothetical protein
MAFVLEDGTGVEGANAYVDLTYARAHHDDRGHLAEWDAAQLSLSITAADASANTVTVADHPYVTGDGPVRLTGTDLPAPLAELTDYWTVVASASALKFSTSYANAVAATPVTVDLTDVGSGTMTIASADFEGQRQAIVRATDYVEGRWGEVFLGERLTDVQGMHWPADGAWYRGDELAGVPDALKRAVSEYALRELTTTLAADSSGGAVVSERVQLGPGEREVTYAAPVSLSTREVPAADRLIRPLLRRAGTSTPHLET